jgi:hypothetical protein
MGTNKMTRKKKSTQKETQVGQGRQRKPRPIPSCITAKSLEERLMCSDQRKRTLTKVLHKAYPKSWPSGVASENFYGILHEFLQQPNGRDRFNAVAKKLEKKNRPIRFHQAFYRHSMAKHAASEELKDICRNLSKSDDSYIELYRWLVKNDSAEEATHAVWAMVLQKSDAVKSVLDGVTELEFLLRPYADYLADQEASIKAKLVSPSVPNVSEKSSLVQKDAERKSISTVLSELQEIVAEITAETIDANQIETVAGITNELSVTLKAELTRDAIVASIIEVFEDAIQALENAGKRPVKNERGMSDLGERLTEDDISTVSTLTDSLNEKNNQIVELQSLIQENVSAENVASMTDAVQQRDRLSQDLLAKLEYDRSFDEDDDHPDVSAEQISTNGAGADEDDTITDAMDKQDGDSQSPELPHTENEVEVSNDQEIAEELDRSNGRQVAPVDASNGVGGKDVEDLEIDDEEASISSPDRESQDDRPAPGVVQRLQSLASAGELSKCYWLAWAEAGLNHSVGVPPIALQCVAAAGELQPGVPPSVTLRRGLTEFAKEDFLSFENKTLGIAAVIPTALFCQQNPAGLYTLVNQLRSSAGESALNELFNETINSCVDQGIWIGESAISSVAIKSGRSERARDVIKSAEQFKQQLPHFNFSYRPAAEAFREIFRSRSGIGRALGIVVGNKENEREWLQEYLKGFDAELMLDDKLSRTRFRGKPLAKVQGGPRTKMLHHVEQVRDMAEQWIFYSSDRIAEPNVQSQRQLVNRVQALMSSAIESLESQMSGNQWRNVVLEFAAKSLVRVNSILSGAHDRLDKGLTTTLALQTEAVITSELQPPELDEQGELTALRNQLLYDSDISIVASVKKCLERHEYARALHLAELGEVPEDIRDQIRESVEHGKNELASTLDEIESDIEDAYLLGLLEGDKEVASDRCFPLNRPALIAQLMEAKKYSGLDNDDSKSDLARSYEIMWDVRSRIEKVRKRNEKFLISELKGILETLKSGSDEQNSDSLYLSEMSMRFEQSGDYIALSELVSQAKEAIAKSARVPRESAFTNEHLSSFSDLEPEIARQWSGPERIAGQITGKKSIAGVHFGDKDSQHCERAAAALTGWASLRSWQQGNNGSRKIVGGVLSVLRLLGVPVSTDAESKIKPEISNDFARLRIPVFGSIFDSPLPAFGSEISSELNVVLIRSKATARELSRFIESEIPSGVSCIVFHVPPIRPTDRKALRSTSIDRQRSALLVDFSMLLYAAGTRDPMLTLFDLGLPSCWSSPYIMKGENVAPETFVGREEETKQVLNSDGSSIIFGGRQLGKSALLRHVQNEYHDPSNGLSIIYLDIDDLGNPPQKHADMVKRLWSLISSELEHIGFIDSKSLPAQQRKEYADGVQSAIRKKLDKDNGKRLIVLLDEADDLLDLDSVHDFQLIKQIRQLMVSTDRRFKVVFAGLQSVQRFTNYPNHPFAQLGEGIAITPLPPMAAWRLVVQPMQALGFEFEDPGLILRVLSQTNYHPGLVQIFCKRLLDKLFSKSFRDDSVPRLIERHDVAAVIRQPEFIDDIRNRFDWTLDLDDRYKVLIYSLVLSGDSSEFREDLQFLRLGAENWPLVFEGMNRQTIRGLLDEMVGLGVLFSDYENGVKVYRLRSPNLLRLLGSRFEIETELTRLKKRGKPRKPNPGNYRPCLQKQPAEFGPLTMEQSSKLLDTSLKNRQPFQIRIVLGSAALGITRVPAQIRYEFERLNEDVDTWRELKLSASDQAVGLERVCDSLKGKLKLTARKHLYTILECSSIPGFASPVDAVELLREKLQTSCRKDSRGLVLVILDEDMTWEWIIDGRRDDVTEDGRVQEVSLQRWGAGSLARALEEAGLRSRAKDCGEDIFKATDGLFSLGESVIQAMQADQKSDWSSKAIDQGVESAIEGECLFQNISNEQLLESISVLADIAEGDEFEWSLAMDLVAECGNPSSDIRDQGGEMFRQWLVATGISSPIQDGLMKLTKHFRLDSIS